jgi:hypothetical protein
MWSMAVHGREPRPCHAGRFVTPSFQITAENPAISAEIGHGGEPQNPHWYLPWPIFDNTADIKNQYSQICWLKLIDGLSSMPSQTEDLWT